VPVELAAWFREKGPHYQAVVVDCLTLWLSNLCERHLLEPQLAVQVDEVIAAIRATSARVVVVTNEIGCGLVPFEPDSRHFRDMAGRVNQQFAAAADKVYVVTCGQSLRLK
jgi:adenosylcobinamide kinase/adenosylcobinamide-phosphate guanylyltransferase